MTMSYNPTNWVNGETPINDSNLNNIEQGLKKVSDLSDAQESKIADIANNQIPEAYLQQSVDNYISKNQAGLATKTDINNLSSEIDAKTSFAKVVMDIANPNNIVENRYWYSAETLADMNGWYSTEIEVKPNTDYSFWNYNYAFTWLLDENKQSLGKMHDIIGGGSDITTPNNCHYIRTSGQTRDFVVINSKGYRASSSKGYMIPIKTEIPTLKDVYVNAEDVSINNPLVATIYDHVDDYNNVASFENGILTQEYSGTGNQWWHIPFSHDDITSNFVLINTKVDSLIGEIRVYLQAYTNSGEIRYLHLYDISSAGEYDNQIDLNYFVVYSNIDLSKNLSILFANKSADLKAVYSKADIFDRVTQLDTDKNLLETLEVMNTDITSLKGNIQTATNNIKLIGSDGQKYVIQVSSGNLVSVPVLPKNILYIGNSLLLGWGTFGMAASNSSEDYYTYVNDYVRSQGIDLVANKISGTTFEGCTTIDAQNQWFNDTLINSLNNDLDMVIIQLGDNVNTAEKLAVFAFGAKNLVKFIREHAPNARVVWVGEWYSNAEKQMYIANACSAYGAVFVDISSLPSVSGNTANIGDVITFDDGTTTTIENSGVASHPSSQGMRAIADRIIETLF